MTHEALERRSLLGRFVSWGLMKGYAVAFAAVAAALLLRWPLWPLLEGRRPYLTLFGGVAAAVWFARWKPAAMAAILGFVAANYFLAEPEGAQAFNTSFLVELVGYALSVGLIIVFGEFLHRARDRAERYAADREKAEESERRQKELLGVTLASIGDGVIVVDSGGRVRSLNAEAERMTGWRDSEASGRPLEEVFRIVNEETHRTVENPVEKVLRTGVVVGLANHTALISKDGSSTPIDDSAAPIRERDGPIQGVVLVFRDVTEQRAAQHAKARLAAIVEHSGDAIITKGLDGVIKTWNGGAESLFGYRPEEVIGKPITLLVPSDRLNEETEILARIRDGQPCERLETVRVAKDGRQIPIAVSVSPLRDGDGRVTGASKVIHDISDVVAARAALAQEKELLATTLASIGDAVITTDAEARITYLNAVAESVTGWKKDDAAGQSLETVFRIVNEETRQTVESPAVRALREGVIMGLANHTVLIRKDGGERPIDDSAAPIRDWKGRVVGCVLVFRDITQRRQAERDMAESRARLIAVLEQLPVGVGVTDLSGRWTLSNPVMSSYVPHGIPSVVPERASRWRSWDAGGGLVPPEDWPGQRALRGEVVPGMEMMYTTDDGRDIWMQMSAAPLRNEAGKIIGATCVVQNIDEAKQTRSERERLRAELAAKVQELQAILDTAPVQIWFGDADCQAFHGNRYAYEEHRLKPGSNASFDAPIKELPEGLRIEVGGRVLAPEEMPMQVAARTGKPINRFEHEVVHPDGRRQTLWANVSPLLNPDGSVRRVVGVYVDITERKRVEEERKRLLESERAARAEAEQASRIKDEFLATLSHELRTPLNAVLGWSRLIETNPGDPRTVSEGIQIIARNAKVQADLIADLLDMSRVISGKLRLEVEDVDLHAVVSAGIDAVRHSADAKVIQIQCAVAPLAGRVRGDANRLQQVVWNLLSNAVKFTPKGGAIQVLVTDEGSHAQIVVSDTGAGIKTEFLPHLFERFRQGDASAARQHGGLGLGLAIVKSLVELHGGSVRAQSAGEGQGAAFTVELPFTTKPPALEGKELRKSEHARGEPTVAPGEDFDFRGIKVLAIDDQADSRHLITRLLEDSHAQVITASSAGEGLKALKEHRPHIVLCDIGMPGEDGYEFIKAMREIGDNTPALAVTAFARSDDRSRALRAGYQGHLAKPIEPSDLVAAVASMVRPPGRGSA
jgi:PAS domain S-box-containing protein